MGISLSLRSVVFQIVVPQIMLQRILEEAHDSPMGRVISVSTRLWRKFGSIFIGPPASRMLNNDVKVKSV